MSIVGMNECVAEIQAHFNECKREERMERINDRELFNSFRIYFTRLPHSKRERRHYIHYIIKTGAWQRIEHRHRALKGLEVRILTEAV